MYDLATAKSQERKRTAEELAKKILQELSELGMRGTRFEVEFYGENDFDSFAASPSADGFDKVRF